MSENKGKQKTFCLFYDFSGKKENIPKRLEIGKRMDDLVQKIGAIFEGTKGLAQQAVKQYSVEVEAIIRERSQDAKRIEWCLSYMLDFCFDDKMLLLYKKLCRYYYCIDPKATVFYVNSYREMWDEESGK